jgi:hypothetical protein
MSLVLLVEGSETEPRVYRDWLQQRFPSLTPAQTVADLTADGYLLIAGNGYPSYARRLSGLLQDIDAHPGKVRSFWVCVDSDEDTYEHRYAEVERAIHDAARETTIQRTNPSLAVHILVQHCCIETWFLGHDGFLRTGPQSRDLVDYKRFFDVSADDPELMGRYPGFATRQSFHEAYLKVMLAERGHRYTKQHPRVVLEPSYFDALVKRCHRTGHLRSFQKLLDALRTSGDQAL